MKTLLPGMLVASPAVVYWVGWIDSQPVAQSAFPSAPSHPATESVVSIPVEVIATGSEPKWIYVQVANQSAANRD